MRGLIRDGAFGPRCRFRAVFGASSEKCVLMSDMARTVPVTVRFTETEKAALERQAGKDHGDVSSLVRRELRAIFERDEREQNMSLRP